MTFLRSDAADPTTMGKSDATPDLRRLWRRTLAVVAPLSAICIATETLVSPAAVSDEAAQRIPAMAESLDRVQLQMGAGAVGLLVAVPSVLALVAATRRRSPRLALVGGVLLYLAFTFTWSMPSTTDIEFIAARDGLDVGAVARVSDLVSNHPVSVISLIVFLLGQLVGLVLLGIAMWRGRVGPRWMAAVLVFSGPAHLLARSNLSAAATWLMTAVGLAGASIALWQMQDDDFDLPPHPRRLSLSPVSGFDARSSWRVLIAVTTPVLALFVTVMRYLLPATTTDDPRAYFDGLISTPTFDAVQVWTGLLVPVVLSGVLAVIIVTRRRAPRLATIGGILSVLGFSALVATGAASGTVMLLASRGEIDRELAFRLFSEMEALPYVGAMSLVFVAGHLLGTVLLGIALWRSRLVPTWIAVGLTVSQPIHLFSVLSGIPVIDLLGWGLTAIGFAAAGVLLLRMHNDDFDLPPELERRPVVAVGESG